MVLLNFNFFIGKLALIQTYVPEEPLMQRVSHYVYCDWWIPTFIAAWVVLNGEATHVILALENKFHV